MKNGYLNWEKLNNHYLYWLQKNSIKEYLTNNHYFDGFSVWWINNLFRKDNIVDNKWYLNLKIILFDKKTIKFNFLIFLVFFNIKFFLNLIIDLIFNIFIKTFFKKNKNINKKNCFYSFSYNLVSINKKLSVDRLYGKTPISDKKEDNFYLIKVEKYRDFFFNKKKYLKKFNNLNLDYCILDQYISLFEIINIYLFSYKIFLNCIYRFHLKKFFFKINKKDCYNVLYPYFLDSFSVSTQRSLISSKAMNNFCKSNDKLNFFINYLEFNPGFVATNYFVRKSKPKIKVISIQHAYASKNMLFYSNHKNDFTKLNKFEGKKFCPSPDYYFIFSQNLKNLLKKYYKKKVIFTGSLRSDLANKVKKDKFLIYNEKKLNILIAPSIGDEYLISDYLKNVKNSSKYNFILSPHPTNFDESIIKFKELKKINFKFNTFRNISTQNLLVKSDLVICSLSSIAIDAKILSKDAIRLVSFKYPYYFEMNEPIKVIKNYKSFLNYLKNFKKKKDKKRKKKYIDFYYYKLDKKSYKRFWNNLKNIKNDCI
jgi:hypothetical protein